MKWLIGVAMLLVSVSPVQAADQDVSAALSQIEHLYNNFVKPKLSGADVYPVTECFWRDNIVPGWEGPVSSDVALVLLNEIYFNNPSAIPGSGYIVQDRDFIGWRACITKYVRR